MGQLETWTPGDLGDPSHRLVVEPTCPACGRALLHDYDCPRFAVKRLPPSFAPEPTSRGETMHDATGRQA
jgi:hypothetical protein